MNKARTSGKKKPAQPSKSAPKAKASPSRKRADLTRKRAKAVNENLGVTQSLPEFLKTAGKLTLEERELIIDQAQIVIENLYVHLPLKRAMHAIDPVQRLKLLRQRHGKLSERVFHNEMLSIFTRLRDLHTNYVLPEPFRSWTAYVPFRIEEFFEDDERHYVVTQVAPTVKDPKFKPGVTITHWNNIPIDRAVEVNAEREAGSNLDARHARGLSAMTKRWMGMSLPPDEEKVTIRYLDGNKKGEIEFDWMVLMPGSPATGVDVLLEKGAIAQLLGVDAKTEVERRVLKLLFSPEALDRERLMAAMPANVLAAAGNQDSPVWMNYLKSTSQAAELNLAKSSTMPDAFSFFGAVETPHGRFGYIRIRTFNVGDDEAFIQEFIRIAQSLPQNGLILDVRGNGGGLLTAGERLLQVLTPKKIDPARLHFINSALTLRLCGTEGFGQWKDSIAQSIETGANFSQGFPLLPIEQYNDIGQKYQGPVVLVIDALCYSTTDVFAAGFQDHQIGRILGTSGNTGAGGANVFTHDLLQEFFTGDDSPVKPLPNGASFRVAIRRTTRVGERATVPIEDLGVVPDELHLINRNDVLNSNIDLINHAAEMLAAMPVYSLTAKCKTTGNTLQIHAATRSLTRVDVLLNNRPSLTLDVKDGPTTFTLPKRSPAEARLELRGYKDEQLAAATILSV
jgi:hypothetical protein